jgi:uncharacterized protein RhaS with RHS repeats
LSRDPIREAGGVNLYGYVGNDPVNYIDLTGLICFGFNKFVNQIEQNRFDLSAALGTLVATEAVGTMPKTPGEMRAFGPKGRINPITGQLSRWSSRFGTRALREFGRTATGVAMGAAATGALVFEGFYDWGVIGKAAWDATSYDDCGCGN